MTLSLTSSRRPYVGITGFKQTRDIEEVQRVVPDVSFRDLMLGIIFHRRVILSDPVTLKKKGELVKQVLTHPHTITLIHYSSEVLRDCSPLSDLLKMHEYAGPGLDGFQLNIVWPLTPFLYDYRTAKGCNPRIILQISNDSIVMMEENPKRVANKLGEYRGLIDDVLIDLSQGQGINMNAEKIRPLLSEICIKHPCFGIGVAGGLDADSLHLVEPLLNEFPHLSIDAEKKLQVPGAGLLHLTAAINYFAAALGMFAKRASSVIEG
jgi:hypothetical protein